jgi:hypothetical protein
VTKTIDLPTNLKLVRISKLHRNRQREFRQIGQAAVGRFKKDFDIPTAAEARNRLAELVNAPNTPQENNRAAWVCEGTPAVPFGSTDPADLVTVDAQVLKLLANMATDTLRLQLIQSLSKKSDATVSRQLIEALRLIIQHHPNPDLRRTYLEEIDHILEAK